MKSTLLCVIGIRLLCQVFAMDATNGLLIGLKNLECADSSKLTPDLISLVRKGQWPGHNDNLKEWVHCVLVRNDFISEQGELQKHVALKYLSKPGVAKKYADIDKCLPIERMPPIELSWQYAKCIQKVDPQNSLF